MAPILKDAETAVTTTSAPASSAPKSPADATRPQPVALEIPVTINGAHTVAGSDKREPFSETTQTVLVFAHGAVVRVATALAPGQLVFLTNEKTRKEVVCQVLKSKSGGSSNNSYVELQFTEPAPSFWGLRTPAGSPVPAVPAPVSNATPRPVASTAPPELLPSPVAPPPAPKPIAATPKPATPPAPFVSVPPPSPLPAANPASPAPAAPLAPPKPVVAPHSPSAVAPVSPTPIATPPVAPAPTTPLVSVPPPSPLTGPPEPPAVSAQPATPQNPPAAEKHASGIPALPLHDYSKEIEALFATPSSSTSRPAPAAPPEPKIVAPPPSTPSTDQLKLEAARLQAQLGSMLFTEPAAPSPTAPPPAPPKPDLRSADIATKVFEIAHERPKSVAPEPALPEPKFVPPAPPRKPVSLSADDEEVKIPSWLAPLSQHAHSSSVAETRDPQAAEPELEVSTPAGEPSTPDSVETSHTYEAPVFGGQPLAESTAESGSEPGPKKALWVGIAAAALIVVGSVAYFLRPMLSGSSSPASSKPPAVAANASAAPSPPSPSAPPVESKPSVSTPANVNSAPAPVPPAPSVAQPSRNSEPAASAPTAEPKASASRNTPAPDLPKKSALGQVHLAAPVVSRNTAKHPTGEPLPAIDTSSNSSSGADALAAVASTHRAQPAAPLPVGGEVTPAQLLKSVPPVYPPVAKAQHITGNVTLDCLIDATGNVADLKVLSGPPLLHRAAADAVKQWKYKPAILDGQPTSMRVTVTVQFRNQ